MTLQLDDSISFNARRMFKEIGEKSENENFGGQLSLHQCRESSVLIGSV